MTKLAVLVLGLGTMTAFALLAASPLFAALVPRPPVGGQVVALGGLNFLVFDNAFADVTEPVI